MGFEKYTSDPEILFKIYQNLNRQTKPSNFDTFWPISWDPMHIFQNRFLHWNREIKQVVLSMMKPINKNTFFSPYKGAEGSLWGARGRPSRLCRELNFFGESYISMFNGNISLANTESNFGLFWTPLYKEAFWIYMNWAALVCLRLSGGWPSWGWWITILAGDGGLPSIALHLVLILWVKLGSKLQACSTLPSGIFWLGFVTWKTKSNPSPTDLDCTVKLDWSLTKSQFGRLHLEVSSFFLAELGGKTPPTPSPDTQ